MGVTFFLPYSARVAGSSRSFWGALSSSDGFSTEASGVLAGSTGLLILAAIRARCALFSWSQDTQTNQKLNAQGARIWKKFSRTLLWDVGD